MQYAPRLTAQNNSESSTSPVSASAGSPARIKTFYSVNIICLRTASAIRSLI